MQLAHRLILCIGAAVLCVGRNSWAQAPRLLAGPSAPHASVAASPRSESPGIRPVDAPLGAEPTTVSLRRIEADLRSDHVTGPAAREMQVLTREIDARLDESARILMGTPAISTLENLGSVWSEIRKDLTARGREVSGSESLLDRDAAALTRLDLTWSDTLASAERERASQEEVARASRAIAAIRWTAEEVGRRHERVRRLQQEIAEQDARVSEMIDSLKLARDEVLRRLVRRDSPPIWSAEVRADTRAHLVAEMDGSFDVQLKALAAYAERLVARFALHAGLIVLLSIGLYRVRSRTRLWAEGEPELKQATRVFETPISSAIVLSILLSHWTYPQAPRLLWAILGAAALVPAVLILRRLVERRFYPILSALVAAYLLDQARTTAAAAPALSRWLFLTEMSGATLFLAWLVLSMRPPTQPRSPVWRVLWAGSRVVFAAIAGALLANALGYVNLGNYLGDGALGSLYLAAILYAVINIADALAAVALRAYPFTLLQTVSRHHDMLLGRTRLLLRASAAVLWSLATLDRLALLEPLAEDARALLNARLTVQTLSVTPANLLEFAAIVWLAFALTRVLTSLLDAEVYPRVNLGLGVSYAISTMLHYTILLVGFYVAVAALGVDMSKFTILAGAFGVGLGFGLQNIVSNFVSGLILLFERPVRVGDVVQLDDAEGVVARIGMRASILRATNGSEIIIPNAKLISDRVTNRTFSNRLRGIQIPVNVASNTDPQRVIALMKEVAAAHSAVADKPAPEALFVQFSPGSLTFDLHVWTDHFEEWERIRSDLAIAIHAAFVTENIVIP